VIRRKTARAKETDEPDPRDGGVQSVDRALSIIETLAEDDEGYRLSDLAIRTGLSTSTVHRLMTSCIAAERLPTLGETVREVAAELTLALGGVMPAAKPA